MLQVSLENTSTLGRRMTIDVPAEQLQIATQAKIKELTKQISLKGFRPGKGRSEIEKKYQKRIQQEVMEELIQKTLNDALNERELKPAGQPQVEKLEHKPLESLNFSVSFELFPEVELKDLEGVELTQAQVEITDGEVTDTLNRLRKQLGEWLEVDRPAEKADRVTIDFASTVNGEAYEHSTGEGVNIELGEGNYIQGLEEGLLGARAGDQLTLDIPFPKEWRLNSLAGQTAVFKIVVHTVAEKKESELNKAFADQVGAQDTSEDAIRAAIKTSLEKQVIDTVKTRTKEDLIKHLLEAHPIELPEALVTREMTEMHKEMHQQNQSEATADCLHSHDGLEKDARERVALGLILSEVIKQNKITLDKAKVKARIQEIGRSFGNAEFVENIYNESEELLQSVQNSVLMDQAIEHYLKQVKLREQSMTFDELMAPPLV